MTWAAMAVCAPGLEPLLASELHALGAASCTPVAGGVEFAHDLADLAWLQRRLRLATRVLVRLGAFRCVHLSDLGKEVRRLPWSAVRHAGQAVRVRATSRLYHTGAVAQRIEAALAAGPGAVDAALEVRVRLQRDVCTVSVDASGDPLYQRGAKQEVAKAPLRETLAAACLTLCGWQPHMPLIDPMCGSGTFVLEAAQWARGGAVLTDRPLAMDRWPGAAAPNTSRDAIACGPPPLLMGADRDAGAVAAASRNAQRAGVAHLVSFARQSLAHLTRPPRPPGWIICNPPWGHRIGDARVLRNLYACLGQCLAHALSGWRLALLTASPPLARATGLRFAGQSAVLPHGGTKVRLYWT